MACDMWVRLRDMGGTYPVRIPVRPNLGCREALNFHPFSLAAVLICSLELLTCQSPRDKR